MCDRFSCAGDLYIDFFITFVTGATLQSQNQRQLQQQQRQQQHGIHDNGAGPVQRHASLDPTRLHARNPQLLPCRTYSDSQKPHPLATSSYHDATSGSKRQLDFSKAPPSVVQTSFSTHPGDDLQNNNPNPSYFPMTAVTGSRNNLLGSDNGGFVWTADNSLNLEDDVFFTKPNYVWRLTTMIWYCSFKVQIIRLKPNVGFFDTRRVLQLLQATICDTASIS